MCVTLAAGAYAVSVEVAFLVFPAALKDDVDFGLAFNSQSLTFLFIEQLGNIYLVQFL